MMLKLKRWFIFFILLTLGGSLLLMPQYKKPRFYISIKGTGAFSNAGDFGAFIDKNTIYYEALGDLPGYQVAITQESFYKGYEGELGIESKNHTVGLSIGFLERNFSVDYSYIDDLTGFQEDYIWNYRFSVIPIQLFIRYRIFSNRFIRASLTLSEGVYLGNYRDERQATYKNYLVTFRNSIVKAKKSSLGFYAGTTIEFNLSKHLALLVDAGYRLVNFKEMTAEGFYEDDEVEDLNEGDFYYQENTRTGEVRFSVGAFDPPRARWEELPAAFNLTGFSVSVGLKITIGSTEKIDK